jgi:SOS response regulatory protein OraA/RecX
VARVTALVAERRARVRVDLDGERWRVLPAEVVARSALRVGEELDRPRLRELRRDLRRFEAVALAAGALRHRDLSVRRLDERLAGRGVAQSDRKQAIEVLERAGVVDDRRVAERRARALAARGWGDGAIAADLRRQGLPSDAVADAVDALEPERVRAERVFDARGRSRRTAMYLSRHGFDQDALGEVGEWFVADGDLPEVG